MRTIDKFKKIWAAKSSIKKYNWPGGRKLVSFTFDDVDESAFKNGGYLLHSHEMKGTFYVTFSFMKGQEGNESIFTEKDVRECVNQGHELGCHTYGHLHAFQASRDSFEEDLKKNQDALEAYGLGRGFESFSYPFGEQTPEVKRLADKRYKSARSIEHGINRGSIDLNSLKSFRLYESKHSIQEVKNALQNLEEQGGWLIFYTHDIKENHSPYGCSPSYFEQVVQLVQSRNFEVRPVAEAVG